MWKVYKILDSVPGEDFLSKFTQLHPTYVREIHSMFYTDFPADEMQFIQRIILAFEANHIAEFIRFIKGIGYVHQRQ